MVGPTHTVTLSGPLSRLLCERQIFCRAACCREAAFELTDRSIARWLDFERTDRTREIGEEILRVESETRCLAGRIALAAKGLESEWEAARFQVFWGRFREIYFRAADARQQGTA